MGWLSKKWKSLKKAVKKIGKGVKKVFGKITKAFGKLGVLGQIGLMFLMPYATGALSSFFGASGTLSGWAGSLMSKAGWGAKALGHSLNIVQKTASFAGRVYTTVTDTIGNTIDRVSNAATGKGFNLSEGRTSIFEKGNERSIFSGKSISSPTSITPPTSNINIDNISIDDKSLLKVNDLAKNIDMQNQLSKSVTESLGLTPAPVKNGWIKDFSDFDFNSITPIKEKIIETAVDKPDSLLDKLIATPGQIVENIKDTTTADIANFAQDQVASVATGGFKAAGTQKFAEALGYKQVTPVSYNINLDNAMGGDQRYNAVFNEIDFMTQPSGNSFFAPNLSNSNYLNNLFMPENPDYQAHMSTWSSDIYHGLGVR